VIIEDQSAHGTIGALIYLVAIVAWLVIWRATDGYDLMTSRVKSLWFPFVLAIGFLSINAVLVFLFDGVGSSDYEESRFVFIDNRAMLAIQALSAILIVATIVYGLTVRRLPLEFIRFMVFAVVAVLGLVAPIVWIPDGFMVGFFLLRHFQNAALLIGLFLCVAGIIVMLADLLAHGEARVVLDPLELLDEERNVEGTEKGSSN
jgi:hypothetical protein